MNIISNQTFDEERALYGQTGLLVDNCRFDGPADGESAFKECRDVKVTSSFFNLRYPFWHDTGLFLRDCQLTELCRAALWYTENVTMEGCRLHGIKALRECANVSIRHCNILSAEFGWFTRGMKMADSTVQGEYFMLRSRDLRLHNVQFKGKYSFQYVENAVVENCTLDTKDAFWHAKNVVVRNCTLKGEYLAWYCENVTFENCIISGTQPLCYCKNLKLINCQVLDADLCFERSEVNATLTAPVVSIKNPYSGHICVPSVGQLIMDDPEARGIVVTK